jgi:hypothetical protein
MPPGAHGRHYSGPAVALQGQKKSNHPRRPARLRPAGSEDLGALIVLVCCAAGIGSAGPANR